MKKRRKPAKIEKGDVKKELIEGFHYTFGHKTMRLILIHFALVSMLGTSFSVLLPVIARDILRGDATLLGFLTGAMGCGALISAVFMARRHRVQGLEKLAGFASTLFGLALITLALSRQAAVSVGTMVLVGMGMIAQMVTSNTYLHLTVDDDKRARVMAFYLLAYFASMPLGSLLTGSLAEVIGAPITIFLCGLACLASSALYFFFLRSSLTETTAR